MIMNMFCQSKLERSHCSALIPDQWHCHTSQTCISLSGHVVMYHDWFQRDTHHAQSHTGYCSSSQTKIWLHFRKRTFCYHIHSTKNRQIEQNNHTSHNAYSTRHLITLHCFLGSKQAWYCESFKTNQFKLQECNMVSSSLAVVVVVPLHQLNMKNFDPLLPS